MGDHSKPLSRWQVVAALAASLGAGLAIASDDAPPRRPASMLGQPLLARPIKSDEDSAIGTDAAAPKEEKKRKPSRHTLRPTRIDSADPQLGKSPSASERKTANGGKSLLAAKEEKIEFAGGTLTKPQRIVPEERPVVAANSSRRTMRVKSTAIEQTTINPHVDVDESDGAAFARSHSLVAAYRAAQNKVEGPLRQPKIVEVESADGDASASDDEVAEESLAVAEKKRRRPAAEETEAAPILSAAELPRPNRSRGAWDTSLPPSLPKTPAMPSVRAASAEEEPSEVEPAKKPRRALTASRLAGPLPQAKGLIPDWSHLKKALGTQNRISSEEAAE